MTAYDGGPDMSARAAEQAGGTAKRETDTRRGEDPLTAAVRCALERHGLYGGKRILVGYSGGGDSSALLHALLSCQARLGITAVAFHLNHGIRGAEADRDEEHCRGFCLEHGAEFIARRADVPAYAREHGMGLEEAARELRYSYLYGIALERGCDCIVTAHHADDELETMLFRLVRGCALAGLCGIPEYSLRSAPHIDPEGSASENGAPEDSTPENGTSGNNAKENAVSDICSEKRKIPVLRPLLSLPRAEIDRYLAENGIEYVTDSTNLEPCCARNIIRSRCVPALRELSPRASESACKTARLLREDEELLSALASLPEERLTELFGSVPAPLLRRRMTALCRGYYSEHGIKAEISSGNIEALARLSESGRLWEELSLPGCVCARKTREGIELSPDRRRIARAKRPRRPKKHTGTGDAAAEEPSPGGTGDAPGQALIRPAADGLVRLTEGENPVPGGTITVSTADREIRQTSSENIYNLSTHIKVSSAKLNGVLIARTRQPGDRIFIHGMSRSLKNLFQSAGIPPERRGLIPLVCDGYGILWIPGVGVRDGAASDTGDILLLFGSSDCLPDSL